MERKPSSDRQLAAQGRMLMSSAEAGPSAWQQQSLRAASPPAMMEAATSMRPPSTPPHDGVVPAGFANTTPPRYTHQPHVASPLRSSLQTKHATSTSQETTPTQSPEDSTASLLAMNGQRIPSTPGISREDAQSHLRSQLQNAFQPYTPADQYTLQQARQQHEQHSTAVSTHPAAWNPNIVDDSSAEQRPQLIQMPSTESTSEATASARVVSNSLGTTQLRSGTPSSTSDYRLEARDGSAYRHSGVSPSVAGYASSLDADYFSAPPSRLVSRTPTPVTGFAPAARASSPEYPASASAESDGEDSDYTSGGHSSWAYNLFGLGGSRLDGTQYRLANQGGKRGYSALHADDDALNVKRGGSRWDRSKSYDARYAAKHPEAGLAGGVHRSSRRRRHRSPSVLPTPLREITSLLAKAFRAVFGPIHPLTVLLALALIAGFVTSVTMLIIYILNPDKEPLPWRRYCMQQAPFPHSLADALAPVNIVVGVLTVDSKFERRDIIRNTYAKHTVPRDANGAPTANVQVKFILGKVRKSLASRIALEMEAYNDIVILDMDETQSARKTHGFLKWAAENATVPFLRPISSASGLTDDKDDSFVLDANAPGGLLSSSQDRKKTWADGTRTGEFGEKVHYEVAWKKVDYVVKADDDTFIVLDELERHLRVAPRELTYWGYLVKNWFMGGEAYALSYDLVDWMAHSHEVSRTAKGKEDIRTPQWIALHPNRSSVNWVSEHCWIYDHPKANTPYSHGFLFPDYVEKIKLEGRRGLSEQDIAFRGGEHASQWYSTVNKWHQKYRLPRHDLTAEEQVEALVEGGGRWAGTWVRAPDGSSGKQWVPYHDIVYEASDARLQPSATDADGRAALAGDVGFDPVSGLPLYGYIDKRHFANASILAEESTNSSSKRTQPRPASLSRDRDGDKLAHAEKRDLIDEISSIPRKFFGDQQEAGRPDVGVNAAALAAANGPNVDASVRFIARPTPKDGFGEWDALRARRYLHRPHGGTVIVHYLKRTEWWLETALALSSRGKMWTNGAGGRGKEWRMGGSPLVRSDGYISEGRSAPHRDIEYSNVHVVPAGQGVESARKNSGRASKYKS